MTTEQKQERKKKLNEIIKQIAKLPQAERDLLATKHGIKTSEGHNLSPWNCVFLVYQGARSLIIGGFRQWQRAGRIVRKGEHATGVIYVPLGLRHKEEIDREDVEIMDKITRFRLVP